MLSNLGFNSSLFKVYELIDDAFRLIGTLPAHISGDQVDSAVYSLNNILRHWNNKGVLQFDEVMLPLKLLNNNFSYQLPPFIANVYDLNLTIMGRHKSGLPYSVGGGTASAAFDDNLTTSCTQVDTNGSIGMAFPAPVLVKYFGVLSNKTDSYQLAFEGSQDGETWVTLYEMTRSERFNGQKSFQNTMWFTTDVPSEYTYYRMKGLNGKVLDITEFYLNNDKQQIWLSSQPRSTYMQQGARDTMGIPSFYSMKKSNNNIFILLYPVPSIPETDPTDYGDYNNYNYLLMRCAKFPEDVKYIRENLNLQQRFVMALTYALATELSRKYSPDKTQGIIQESMQIFEQAKSTDSDMGGIKFTLQDRG